MRWIAVLVCMLLSLPVFADSDTRIMIRDFDMTCISGRDENDGGSGLMTSASTHSDTQILNVHQYHCARMFLGVNNGTGHYRIFMENYSGQYAPSSTIMHYFDGNYIVHNGGKLGDLDGVQHIHRTANMKDFAFNHWTIGKIDSGNGWGSTQNASKLINNRNCGSGDVPEPGVDFEDPNTLFFTERGVYHDMLLLPDDSEKRAIEIGASSCQTVRAFTFANSLLSGNADESQSGNIANSHGTQNMKFVNIITDLRVPADGELYRLYGIHIGSVTSSYVTDMTEHYALGLTGISNTSVADRSPVYLSGSSSSTHFAFNVGMFDGGGDGDSTAIVDTTSGTQDYCGAGDNPPGSCNKIVTSTPFAITVPAYPTKPSDYFPTASAGAFNSGAVYHPMNPLDFYLRERNSGADTIGAMCPSAGC